MQTTLTKSKILCTLGPSTNTVKQIKNLVDLGMDCARINFSHGTNADKETLFNNIREANETVAVLCDIQGPKIRIGQIKEGGAFLHNGKKIIVTTEEITGDKNKITISHKKLPEEVKKDDLIYINDGLICLKVNKIENREIECDVVTGGNISSRKGVNLPSTEISLRVPTKKDIEDLALIAKLDPEYVAISFVCDKEDVLSVRKVLKENGNSNVKLISKIERPIALENFDSILEASDGIMVARGDLGVEIPPEDVIPAQKEMIRKCNIAGKVVIVATQMLESMVKSPVPTRAEVSDVYNAIEDGADAVMLSAETASGDYPEKAVEIMERTIRTSESLSFRTRDPEDFDSQRESFSEVIGHLVYSACNEFCEMGFENGKIICITQSGYSSHMISKYRPFLPILGITSNKRVAREMRLVWGVEPIYIPDIDLEDCNAMNRVVHTVKTCFDQKLLEEEDKIIIAGNIFNLKSQTNTVSIFRAKDLLGDKV